MAAYYRASAMNGNPLVSYHPSNRVTGQIIGSGADFEIVNENSVFFLEQIEVGSGVTVKVSDGAGNEIIPVIGQLSCEMSPIRCDNGIVIDGTVLMVKGFFIEDSIR